MKRIKTIFLLLLMLAVILCGCKGTPAEPVPETDTVSEIAPEPESGETAPDETETPSGTQEEENKKPSAEQKKKPETVSEYVDSLTLEEQVAQIFFVMNRGDIAAELVSSYNIGGVVLLANSFKNQNFSTTPVNNLMLTDGAKTPVLLAVDEEGGTVTRISSEPAFRETKFLSPREGFAAGGFDYIVKETAEKNTLLRSLSVHMNLAPVCDMSDDPEDFIYARSFGDNTENVCDFVTKVVTQCREDNIAVSLKHFPGYASNADTHTGSSVDTRSLGELRTRDFLPFAAGIAAGADSVLVSHNILQNVDSLPCSLSKPVHDILRDELGFEGLIVTDDISMKAITGVYPSETAAVLAVNAGNDMVMTSDFVTQYNAVLAAVKNGTVSTETVRTAVERIIKLKVNLGLIKLQV